MTDQELFSAYLKLRDYRTRIETKMKELSAKLHKSMGETGQIEADGFTVKCGWTTHVAWKEHLIELIGPLRVKHILDHTPKTKRLDIKESK